MVKLSNAKGRLRPPKVGFVGETEMQVTDRCG
jgi:hypothetical protein